MRIDIIPKVRIENPTKFHSGDILGYKNSSTEFLVVGEDDLYLHTFTLDRGQYWGIFKLQPANIECLEMRKKTIVHDVKL